MEKESESRRRKEEGGGGSRDGKDEAWKESGKEGKRKRLKRRGTADVNEKLLPLMDSPRGHRDLRG